jgi:hypothetical protein
MAEWRRFLPAAKKYAAYLQAGIMPAAYFA